MLTILHVEQPPLGTLIYNTTTQQGEVLTRDGWVPCPLEWSLPPWEDDSEDSDENNEED